MAAPRFPFRTFSYRTFGFRFTARAPGTRFPRARGTVARDRSCLRAAFIAVLACVRLGACTFTFVAYAARTPVTPFTRGRITRAALRPFTLAPARLRITARTGFYFGFYRSYRSRTAVRRRFITKPSTARIILV